MNRNFGVLASTVLTLGFVAYACTSGEVVDGPLTGSAGSGNPAGMAGNGPGNAGTQGQAGRGGTTGQGAVTGQAGRGGTTGAAGSNPPRGGTTGTGNTIGGGGTTGTGNTIGTAGTTGAGNSLGQAGTTGSGGSGSVTCGAAFDAAADGFVRTPSLGGCWHGYAFAGGDTGSTISPTTFGSCGTPCMLKMTGTVGPAVAPAYAGVAYLGFNLAQDNGSMTKGVVTPTGTGVKVTFSATTSTLPLRAQISSGSTFWCFTITGGSPAMIPYASFNTACWDNSGTAFGKVPIDNFELVVPGGMTATSGVSVTLSGVQEY